MNDANVAPVTCGACGSRFDRGAWDLLVLVARLEPDEVRRVMLGWPDDLCIEVRRCRCCSRDIPAKRGAVTVARRVAV